MSEEKKKARKITVNLTDADSEAIFQKAAAHGLTVGELLENFIADLIGGAGTNGSDERDRAEAWFERCWFGMFPEETFLRWLIEWGADSVSDFCARWELLQDAKEDIKDEERPEYREAIQEEIDFQTEELQSYYNDYVEWCRDGEPQTLEEAAAAVLEYREKLERFVEQGRE